MKQFFTLFFLILTLGSSAQVRISQVYGGGGNASATYNQDFVEIFNAGSSSVAIGGWSVQYASATGPATSPFNWAVAAIPAGATIGAGQYYLVALATGATGVALPTPDATITSINMSGTAGKVALVNNNTPITGTTACNAATVVDVLGYGSTATCSETAVFLTTGITNAQSMMRASNGCTDANNNSTDFAIATVAPRNTASATNSCGGPTPLISAGPNITNITTTVGTASASQSYNLSASNLTPAAGNITITPSANVEVSADNSTFSASAINVAYTGGALASTPIYVRLAAGVPQGAFSGTVTNAGGGAPNATVTVTGGVFQNYYSKATGDLEVLGTWGTNTDGTGATPANFTTAYQIFNVVNQSSATIGAGWDVSGTNAKIVVGDGVSATVLVVPTTAAITSTSRVDVSSNATLRMINNTRPFLGSLTTGSTVDFAQTGFTSADTIRIPAISYHHLVFTGGLKYFSGGTTTIRGNFTVNGVVSMNGAGSPFSTVNAFGNIAFQSASSFEPNPSGDAARLTLAMNGTGVQTITGEVDVRLFRLRRDSISSSVNIIADGSVAFILGNNAGGGLQLNQGAATTTTLTKGGGNITFIGAGTSTTASQGRIVSTGGALTINKTVGTTNAGTLRFATGSAVDELALNFDVAQTRDSITIANDLTVLANLALTKGRVVMASGTTLTVDEFAGITGGSTTSFVDGRLRRYSSTSMFVPVGKGTKYAPVQIDNMSGFNNYIIQYFNSGLGTYTIDPATLTTFANYNVSVYEYWNILQADAGTCDITFNYTDANSLINVPNGIRMAHFDGVDWNDIGGTPGGANTVTNGNVTVTNVADFSPFTFAAINPGVIPVRLGSFSAQKNNNTVALRWTTAQEINSSRFEIERSTDGRNWSSIATVNAVGNSNLPLAYSATDALPVTGLNYYRLKMIDTDGRFEYSVIKTILFGSKYEVVVAPNPATSYINVYMSKANTQPVQVILTDVNGKAITSINTTEQQVRINTASLARGMYFVKIYEGTNTTVQKISVQ